MSNPLSIAAVTATLRNLLAKVAVPFDGEPDTELSDTQVSTLPLDKAGTQEDHNQINLFLYQVAPNVAGRNLDGQGLPGKPPGLALDLFYMVTVYGRNNNDILSQRLLGRLMSLFHSHPLLVPAEIEAALVGNDLHELQNRVRITPHVMANEEMVRMWSTFQVKYRLSVVYRVGPVLIDHEVATSEAALPTRVVLTLGPSATATTTSSGAGG
jgi:hypothetical protein